MYIGEKLCQKYNFYFFEKKFFSHSKLQLNKMSVFLIVMMLFAVKKLVRVELRRWRQFSLVEFEKNDKFSLIFHSNFNLIKSFLKKFLYLRQLMNLNHIKRGLMGTPKSRPLTIKAWRLNNDFNGYRKKVHEDQNLWVPKIEARKQTRFVVLYLFKNHKSTQLKSRVTSISLFFNKK